MTLSKIVIVLIAVVVVVVLYDIAKFYRQVSIGKSLAVETIPFERVVSNADMRILVTGDSTAFGTGATDSAFSTAGRLGAHFENSEIVNISENGLKVAGLVQKLKAVELEEFDLAVAQIGANDILRFTDMKEFEQSLVELLEILSKNAKQVVILHSATVGDALIFPRYIGYFYNKRSYLVREMYIRITDKYENVSYVDLIGRDQETVLFQDDPLQFYATDKLHLGDEGYRVWFEEILKKVD